MAAHVIGFSMRTIQAETAKLQAQFDEAQLQFVQTELQVAIQMARIAHTEFLMGDVAHACRSAYWDCQ